MTSNSEMKIFEGLFGFRMNKRFAIGAEVFIRDLETNNDSNNIGISSSYRMPDNYYLGLGIEKSHLNTVDLGTLLIHGGLGIIRKKYTLEGVLIYESGDQRGTAYIPDALTLRSEWTYRMTRRLELYGVVSYQSKKADDASNNIDEKEKAFRIEGELEYLVNRNVAIGALAEIAKIDNDNKMILRETEANNKLLGIAGRLKRGDFQLAGTYKFGTRENVENSIATDSDLKEWDIRLSYFF